VCGNALCFIVRNKGNFCFSAHKTPSAGEQIDFNEILSDRQTDVSGTDCFRIFTSYTLKMGDGVSCRNVGKPSHFDAAVCQRKFHVPAKASRFMNKFLFYNNNNKRTHNFCLLYQIRIQAKPL